MMISPEAYLEQMKDATYEQLIKERDGLIRYVRRYEKTEKAGVRSGDEWMICPSPDVRYQMDIPDTQHLQPDQEVYLEMLFADLVRHLEKISPRYAEIVTLGKAGYEPDEIIAKINLKKSRGYQELAKAEELARKFIYGM